MLDKFQGKGRAGLLLAGLVVLVAAGAFLFHSGATPKVNASTALWPATASPGGTIFVTGSGFPSQERVKVYFQAADRGVIDAVANANGSFSVPLTVPSAYIPGTKYYVYANSDVYSTQMLFNFAKLNISPTDPLIKSAFGSPTSFTGTGFRPNERVNLAWDCATGGTLNAGTALAGSDGSFITVLTMPSTPYGTQCKLVAAGNSSSSSASAALSEAPGLIYDPSSAPAGTAVNVKGGSFGRNEQVNVSFLGSTMATVKTDASGSFTTSFTVPDINLIGYQDSAIVAAGTVSGAKAKGGFDKEPKIGVNPNHGGVGTRVQISGKHFSGNGQVNIYLVSDKEHESKVDRCLLANLNATAKGTFSIVVTIPKGDCLEDLSHIVAVDVKTGDRGVVTFFGEDNDEGHED